MIKQDYRIVTKAFTEVSSYGAGKKVARFNRDFVLLSCAYFNAGIVDYLAHDSIAKAPADTMSSEDFTMLQVQRHPLFFDPSGSFGHLAILSWGGVALPYSSDTELHFTTTANTIVLTYLEKI